MGYDLNFWKYKGDGKQNHREVYESLSNGETVESLEELPIKAILNSIETKFPAPTWEKFDKFTYESATGTFQVYTTTQFFRIDCYGLSGDEMNRFIDVGNEYSCPLYDPQVGERYDGT